MKLQTHITMLACCSLTIGTVSACNRTHHIEQVKTLSPSNTQRSSPSKMPSLGAMPSPDSVEKILRKSDSIRQSEGASPIKLLWACDTEKELFIWGQAAGVLLYKRFPMNGILVLLGEEGSGIPRKTIYVYSNAGEQCQLIAVRPTSGNKINVEYDQASRTLTFWSSSTFEGSGKLSKCLILPL